MSKSLTYADAGVDIEKTDRFVEKLKEIARQTNRPGVMSAIGGFGGLFSLNVGSYDTPVLVSSTDGVGTKLRVACMAGKHDTIGIDLVAMSVNDIAVQGAKPLFFLDYLSMGKFDAAIAEAVVQGVGKGCVEAQCALIGGETAEMPGFYGPGEYDLAGFAVGVVDNHKIVDGSEISVGHRLLGVGSSGLHSNGFSLVRKVCFDVLKLKLDDYVEDLGKTLSEELLVPTTIYADLIRMLHRDFPIHGMAHITGGGLVDNILRIIPKSCNVSIDPATWTPGPIFQFIQAAGNIDTMEMRRTFNNGIGLVLVLPESAGEEVVERVRAMDMEVFNIGQVIERTEGSQQVVWLD